MPDEEKPQSPRPPEGKHDNPHGSFLHLNDVHEHKWRWVKAARHAGLRLHDWVVQSLNRSAHTTVSPASSTQNQNPNDPPNDPANGPTGKH